MNPSQQKFIALCIRQKILRFGAFTLKSGRVSPYFFNAGLFNSGMLLSELGAAYADLLTRRIPDLDDGYMLYGPAYKGIPLAATTVLKLQDHHNINLPFAFNRKEVKDHGEGGSIIGAPLKGKVIIIDDVITAGTSVTESVAVIEAAGAQPAGVAIAVDRQESAGDQGLSAVQNVERQFGIPVHTIIALDDLVSHLEQGTESSHLAAIRLYRQQYGEQKPEPATIGTKGC